MQEKYGFIYVWYDRKYNLYYIGRHWGYVDDGYICSSTKMRRARSRRPDDFKRRVVKILHDKLLLVKEEQRWLDMIKPNEVNTRYYNVSLKASTPTMCGRMHSEETKLKMSLSMKGRPKSEEHKQKIRMIRLGTKASEETKLKMSLQRIGKKRSIEFCQKMSEIHSNRSEETRAKISAITKQRRAQGTFGRPRKKTASVQH